MLNSSNNIQTISTEISKKIDWNNPVQRKQRYKKYYIQNKEKYKQQNTSTEKARRSAYGEQWRLDNKAKLTVNRKQYRLNNKAEITVDLKQRLQTDTLFKSKCTLRNLVYGAFKRIGQNKPARTEQLLGCSWIEAKAHFERLFQEGMTWENHGKWHIDHIRPVASFKEDELHLMNHISNLQPLWAEENLGPKKVSDKIKYEL